MSPGSLDLNPLNRPRTHSRRPLFPAHYWSYRYIALLAGIVALARAASTVGVFNHTTDELSHIAAAVGFYESGRNLYMVEHPPLQRIIVGGVLKIAGVGYPPARSIVELPPRPEANLAGEAIAFHGNVPYWRILVLARCANLIFLAALLIFVWLLGRYLAGPLVAMCATVLVSLDPSLLAHGALVTTDVPAAAGFIAATYFAIRFLARPNWRRALAAGIALGLGMACKFTCVLLVPPVLLLMLIRAYRHAQRSRTGGSMLRRMIEHFPALRHLAAIAILAFLTMWATYLFNVGRLDDQELFTDEKTWLAIPQTLKNATIPMPSMVLGMMFMAALGKTGFPCYLNGQLDFKGHLAYFPEAIALKMPAAFVLALLIAAIVILLTRPRRWLRLACIILPASLLMLSAMTGKLQIGIRHILPVLPFLYLLVAMVLGRGWRVGALLGVIMLVIVETAPAHPDYLAFFNVYAGGRGEKYLADSNLDWGQDVARLADYVKSTGRRDYAIKVSGARVAALVKYLGLNPGSRDVDPGALHKNPHGLLAIGVNAKLGLEDFKRNRDGTISRGHDYSWLRDYPVIQRIGKSIEIYDLDHPADDRRWEALNDSLRLPASNPGR